MFTINQKNNYTTVLVPLGLTAAASATVTPIQKEIIGSEITMIISNKEMDDTIKIIKSLKESDLLIKVVSETINNESIVQKGEFLSNLLGILGASFLGNRLAGKRVIWASEGTKEF